jgi:hypothetical protein
VVERSSHGATCEPTDWQNGQAAEQRNHEQSIAELIPDLERLVARVSLNDDDALKVIGFYLYRPRTGAANGVEISATQRTRPRHPASVG